MPAVTDEIGVVMAESTREVLGVSPPDMVARSMNAASNMNTAAKILNFALLKKSRTPAPPSAWGQSLL